ncbi:MAG: D-cysteine desulfhydrase family protein [Chloroflexi bacterium]|nr:D-cysteine desulfhydrase family protein [Chloroflexota bacterium]MCL5076000.1 D-cysteine desulfhydrase family protein [Chloroflexota bacterium]
MTSREEKLFAPGDLQVLVDRVPRVQLANLPTPLHDCPRLSETLGGPRILFKRDDLTGLALGGNKVRQLEFIMADALAKGSEMVIVGAGSQSNLCCLTAAAACKLGMRAILVLMRDDKSQDIEGNLLLDGLFGAEVRFVDTADFYQLPTFYEAVAVECRQRGQKSYIINPWSFAGTLATVGYVNFVLEFCQQLDEMKLSVDHIFTAATDATPAGLALGTKLLNPGFRVVGISPAHLKERATSRIARIASDTAKFLGIDLVIAPDEITNYEDYVGEGYGVMTRECREAISLVAETEGILLDPVYTGKAMAGLIDHIRRGKIGRGETVTFLHTGGTPLLFAYRMELTPHLVKGGMSAQ